VTASVWRDFEGWELGVALLAALFVQVGAGFALHAANMANAAMPEIDKGAEVPVKVTPVIDMDSPLLKLGSKKRAVLPDVWKIKPPRVHVEEKTYASTKAEKTEEAIPDKDIEMAPADAEAPPPDAEIVKETDQEITEEADAGELAMDEEGSELGTKEGTETDPLKARAVDQYRARLAGFFQGGFRVTGTGLSQEELTKIGVPANVQLSGLTVSGFSISPSGNAAFDAAATAALQSKVGQQIPPPPENYPDILQAAVNVTFRCGKDVCN
jgi:hypothetical protein